MERLKTKVEKTVSGYNLKFCKEKNQYQVYVGNKLLYVVSKSDGEAFLRNLQ
jgi:hypothetical protein